jgi:3-hydroxyisobutyrate dehydrogenase-like beta-hydroxyacid dehydrogenase
VRIGLLHPGEMGAAAGAALAGAGHRVVWASEGRSPRTAERAAAAGLDDLGTVAAVAAGVELLVSVCPPHGAVELAREVTAAGFAGVYLDANAVAPDTAREVGRLVVEAGGRFVDGGIIGPPPTRPGTTRLYLSGPDAVEVSEAWVTPLVETHVVSEWPGAASALKLAYAAWTKGSAALLLAVRAAAETEGVSDWLLDEWRTSQPDLADRCAGAARSALAKGWRWAGEMEEIATMLAAGGLPAGFHTAAAEVFACSPRDPSGGADGAAALTVVLDSLRAGPPPPAP